MTGLLIGNWIYLSNVHWNENPWKINLDSGCKLQKPAVILMLTLHSSLARVLSKSCGLFGLMGLIKCESFVWDWMLAPAVISFIANFNQGQDQSASDPILSISVDTQVLSRPDQSAHNWSATNNFPCCEQQFWLRFLPNRFVVFNLIDPNFATKFKMLGFGTFPNLGLTGNNDLLARAMW